MARHPHMKLGEKPKVKNLQATIKRIFSYLLLSKGTVSLVFFMVIANSIFSLLGPYFLGVTIDKLLSFKDSSVFFFYLVLLLGVYACTALTSFLQNYWMIGVSQSTIFTLRTQLFRKLHQLSIRFFDKRQTGDLMSRVTNDIDNISQTLNTAVIELISSVLILVGTLVLMIYLSPVLTVVTLIVVPIMFFGVKWITNRTSKLFKQQQRNLGSMNGFIEESISGQKIIKAFSEEQAVIKQFKEKNIQLKVSGFWAQTYSGFIPKLMNVLNNLSYALIAAVGGYLAFHHSISIGVIVSFTEYSRQFTRPLNDLSNQFNTLLSAVAGAERVFDILDETHEEETDDAKDKLPSTIKGKVSFYHVHFSYENNEPTVMDIHFTANPGETVAFVGPTGAGKTTVIQLFIRFYDITSGKITIDDKDIYELTREDLRSHMGFVLQETYLFQESIRENIRYGRLDATDAEVEHAAKLANAHEFITAMPQQYDTVLNEGGGISQGQKQLISIARAILADPQILILDEATSSIDTMTEIRIQEALDRLMKGRTSFVIAHRLNTIRHADKIIVLKEGRMIESGTHESLIEQKGFYYGLQHSSEEKLQNNQA